MTMYRRCWRCVVGNVDVLTFFGCPQSSESMHLSFFCDGTTALVSRCPLRGGCLMAALCRGVVRFARSQLAAIGSHQSFMDDRRRCLIATDPSFAAAGYRETMEEAQAPRGGISSTHDINIRLHILTVYTAMESLRAENDALRAQVAELEAAAAASAAASATCAAAAVVAAAGSSSSKISAAQTSPTSTPTFGDVDNDNNDMTCGNGSSGTGGDGGGKDVSRSSLGKAGMTAAEVARYSRHLLVPAVGVEGQRNLLGKTCLVIGAGGLASAVLPYLAGAGVGHIKIIDFDKIETSNLHRQVLFREAHAGKSKAQTAADAVRAINSRIRCTAIEAALSHENALEVLAGVDLVVDASDNPRTRYLVNDACVLAGKPLVSGSALGMEGQISVFHYREQRGEGEGKGEGGPCYRCVFPAPLAAEAGRRCSDNGVLGSVPGVIGCLQATEALKVLGEFGSPLVGRLCTYDAQNGSFFTVRLRPRSKTCAACGDSPAITSMEASKAFAAEHGLTVARAVPTTPDVPTATCQEYAIVLAEGRRHVLLDVRAEVQFAVCALDNAVNIPLSRLQASMDKVESLSEGRSLPLYCICRRGVDSRRAVEILAQEGFYSVTDVSGGLTEWAKTVDRNFPMY